MKILLKGERSLFIVATVILSDKSPSALTLIPATGEGM